MTKTAATHWAAGAVTLALVCASAPALASPFEVYGAGARAIALGNAMTAEADGADALFYNVAGLTRATPGVSVGLMMGMDNARIALNPRPDGYDIPDLGSNNPTVASSATLQERSDTDPMGTFGMVTIGGVTGLGTDRFRAGLLATFGVAGIEDSQTRFSDERERLFSNQLQYELINGRARRFDIEAGLAFRVFGPISVGLGVHVQPTVSLINEVYLENATDQRVVQINLRQRQGFGAGLTGGLLVEISENLRLGLSGRQNLGFNIEGQNQIQIRGLDASQEDYPIIQEIGWVPSSSPSTFSLGGATDVGKATFLLDVKYAIWSGYRDTQGEDAGFNNTITPRVGVEYRFNPRMTARIGGSYEVSPVPDQTGRTNYVDNDRVVASIGAAHRFELLSREFEVSWYVQSQALLSRSTSKTTAGAYPVCADGVTLLCDEVPDDLIDGRTGQPLPGVTGLQTANPGFPGFASGGWMGAIGVELRWLL